MSGIFDYSRSAREEMLKYVYRLQESLEKKYQRLPGTKKDITRLFFIKTERGASFVEKKGVQGRTISLIRGFQEFFREKSRSYDVVQNIEELAKIIEQVAGEDDELFETVAGSLNVEVMTLREKIGALRQELNSLSAHVTKTKKIKARKITGKPPQMPRIIELPSQQTKISFNRAVEAAVKELFPQQTQDIIEFLKTYSELENILPDVLDSSKADTERREVVRQGIWKSIVITQNDAERRWLEKLLETVSEPVEEYVGPPLEQKTFAQIFGDPFIKGSGLEGNISAKIFTNLVCDFIDVFDPEGKTLRALREEVADPIDLRDVQKDLGGEIQRRIQTSSSKKCLLIGGWIGHAIVYEIEQQKNGKYAFRAFNQGEGVQYHQQFVPRYQEKVAPCIAVKDISSRSLFNPSFLSSFQSLVELGEGSEVKPAELLAVYLLPLLGGTGEALPDHVQSQVTPQKSGTCTYKSVEAFLCRSMSQEDFRLFKFEFRLYLLRRYMPNLEKSLEGEIPNYEEARLEYAMLTRSIEHFSQKANRISFSISEKKKKEVQALLNRYDMLLKAYDSKILAYEKETYAQAVPIVPKNLTPYTVSEKGEGVFDVIDSATDARPRGIPPVSEETMRFLLEVNQLPPFGHDSFSDAFLNMIRDVQKLPDQDKIEALNAIVKTIPSFHAWDTLHFSQSEEAMKTIRGALQGLSERICTTVSHDAFFIYFSLQKGFQSAYAAWAREQKMEKSLTSFFGHELTENLASLQVSDPYWSRFRKDLEHHISLQKDRNPFAAMNPFKMELYSNDREEFEVPPSVIGMIDEWWNLDSSQDVREKFMRSVKEDRDAQRAKIEDDQDRKKRTIEECTKAIERCTKERDDTEMVKGRNSEDFHKITMRLNELNRNKLEAQNDLQITPESVRWAQTYWPPDVESNAPRRAALFFAPLDRFGALFGSVEGPVPEEMQIYFEQAQLCSQIFYKTKIGPSVPVSRMDPKKRRRLWDHVYALWDDALGFIWDKSGKILIHVNNHKDLSIPKKRKDGYSSAFENRQFLSWVYGALLLGRDPIAETSIQSIVSGLQDIKEHLDLSKHVPLEEDALRELVAIREVDAGKLLQIDSLLSYFWEHSRELFDPAYFALFHYLLFESDALVLALENERGCEATILNLKKFFDDKIQEAVALEDVQWAANMAWIGSQVDRYISFVDGERGRKEQRAHTIVPLQRLRNIFDMASEEKHRDQRPLAYEALSAAAASLCTSFPTPEEEELFAMVCIAQGMRNFVEVPPTMRFQIRNDDASFSRIRLLEFLKTYEPERVAAILDRHGAGGVLGRIDPRLKKCCCQFSQEKQCFHLKDRDGNEIARLMLDSADLEFIGETKQYKGPVPEKVQESLVRTGIVPSGEDFSKMRYAASGEMITIKDTEKNFYIGLSRATEPESIVYIAHGRDGDDTLLDWMRYVPVASRTGASSVLRDAYTWAYGRDGVLYLSDPESRTPIFRSDEGPPPVLKQCDTDLILASPSPEDTDAFSLLRLVRSFEDPNWTICLMDEAHTLQRIEIPRMGLSLSNAEGRWKVEEQPGWFLSQEQFVPHFGQSTGFLVLESGQGEKKALLPLFSPKEEEKESLHFSYQYDHERARSARSVQYVEVDIQDDRTLRPKTLEARYHLASIFLKKGYIDDAEKLLFHHQAFVSSRKLTESEACFLQGLVLDTSDIGARSVKIRLHALFLLEKNLFLFPQSATRVQDARAQDSIQDLFDSYLRSLSQLTPLEKSEELFLIRHLEGVVQDTPLMRKVQSRKSELTGERPPGPPPEKQIAIEIPPTREQMKAHAEQEISPAIPIPLRRDKARYRFARLFGGFPFDPRTVSGSTFLRFYPLLEAECRKQTSWDNGVKSGLFPLLYHMALFSEDQEIRNLSWAALEGVGGKRQEKVKKLLGSGAPPGPKVKGKRDRIDVRRPLRDLIGVEFFETSEKGYLGLKADEYFERRLASTKGIGKEIFSEHAPEIAGDLTTKKKFARAQEDIEHAASLQGPDEYALKGGMDLACLEDSLDEERATAETQLQCLEDSIIKAVSFALTATPSSRFAFMGKKRVLPTIDELCLISSKKDASTYIEKIYPELSSKGIEQLRAAVTTYLRQKACLQQMKRSLSLLSTYRTLTESGLPQDQLTREKQSLLNQLGQTMSAERAYDMKQENALQYLLVETVFDVMLRSDQVGNIQKFIDARQEERECALQAIMGSGKTSTLQPILAFLFASPGTFSVVDVPEALCPVVLDGLSNALGNTFQQYVFHLAFDRELAKDVAYLRMVETTISEVTEKGGCFLRTPKFKHAIITGFYEALYDSSISDTPENRERVDALSRIITLLKEREIVQIDEIDLTLNPQVVHRLPIGAPEVVDEDQATLLSEIVLAMAQDRAIAEIVSVDFIDAFQKKLDPTYQKKGAPLTEELYRNKVQPRLADIALRLFLRHAPHVEITDGSEGERHLLDFVCGSCAPDTLSWIEENIEDEATRDLLTAAAEAIDPIFLESLFKACGSQYGEDPKQGRYVARPYNAPKDPKTTMFQDALRLVLYSTQALLYYGIPESAAAAMLKDLREDARKELPQAPLAKIDGYRRFQQIMGDDVTRFSFLADPPSEELIKIFGKRGSDMGEILLEFLKAHVFHQIKTSPLSISSTSQTLCGSSKLVYGYTGTLHDGILPMTMSAIPELGTDGKTILAVDEQMASKRADVYFLGDTDADALDSVIKKFEDDSDLFVFLDSGGNLKRESPVAFAMRLLEALRRSGTRPEVRGVVVHDPDGRLISIEYDENDVIQIVPLSRSRYSTEDGTLLTVITQKHETGTDISQKSTAKALMSVRKNMAKRALLQSSSRMRKVRAGQVISFCMNEDVRRDMAGRIWAGMIKDTAFLSALRSCATWDRFRQEIEEMSELELSQDILDALKNGWSSVQGKTGESRVQSMEEKFCVLFLPCSDSVWTCATANEAREEQEKNWMAAIQKMRAVIENPVRTVLADCSLGLEVRLGLFKAISDLIIEKRSDRLFERRKAGRETLSREEAIDRQVASHMHYVDMLTQLQGINSAAAKVLEEMDGLYDRPIEEVLRSCVKPEDIAASIKMSGGGEDQEVERLQELEQEFEEEYETEQERQQDLEVQQDQSVSHSNARYDRLNPQLVFEGKEERIRPLSHLVVQDTLGAYLRVVALPDRDKMSFSVNLFPEPEGRDAVRKNVHLANGPCYMSGRYFLAISDTSTRKTRYVLISHTDASMFKREIGQFAEEGKRVALFTFDGVETASSSTDEESPIPREELDRVIIQSKLITGRTQFSRKEIHAIQEWIQKKEVDPKQLKAFYERSIQMRPDAVQRYNKGLLKKMFESQRVVESQGALELVDVSTRTETYDMTYILDLGSQTIDFSNAEQLDAISYHRSGTDAEKQQMVLNGLLEGVTANSRVILRGIHEDGTDSFTHRFSDSSVRVYQIVEALRKNKKIKDATGASRLTIELALTDGFDGSVRGWKGGEQGKSFAFRLIQELHKHGIRAEIVGSHWTYLGNSLDPL